MKGGQTIKRAASRGGRLWRVITLPLLGLLLLIGPMSVVLGVNLTAERGTLSDDETQLTTDYAGVRLAGGLHLTIQQSVGVASGGMLLGSASRRRDHGDWTIGSRLWWPGLGGNDLLTTMQQRLRFNSPQRPAYFAPDLSLAGLELRWPRAALVSSGNMVTPIRVTASAGYVHIPGWLMLIGSLLAAWRLVVRWRRWRRGREPAFEVVIEASAARD